jgi:hypothetical protein
MSTLIISLHELLMQGREVRTKFLGIRALRDGKAMTVHAKVVEMMTEADLDMEHKLSGT